MAVGVPGNYPAGSDQRAREGVGTGAHELCAGEQPYVGIGAGGSGQPAPADGDATCPVGCIHGHRCWNSTRRQACFRRKYWWTLGRVGPGERA